MKVVQAIFFVFLSLLAPANGYEFVVIKALFNVFSFLFVGRFNEFVGTSLAPFDPFDVDDQSSSVVVDLGEIETDACDGKVAAFASFGLKDMTGLSTLTVDKVKMTESTFYAAAGPGDIAYSIGVSGDSLVMNVEGDLDVEGCDDGQETQAFTGTVGVVDPEFEFEFDFDGAVPLLGGISVDDVTINEFSFTYDSIDIDVTDLGDFESIKGTLTAEVNALADDFLQSAINATFLQNAIDEILPFVS